MIGRWLRRERRLAGFDQRVASVLRPRAARVGVDMSGRRAIPPSGGRTSIVSARARKRGAA